MNETLTYRLSALLQSAGITVTKQWGALIDELSAFENLRRDRDASVRAYAGRNRPLKSTFRDFNALCLKEDVPVERMPMLWKFWRQSWLSAMNVKGVK